MRCKMVVKRRKRQAVRYGELTCDQVAELVRSRLNPNDGQLLARIEEHLSRCGCYRISCTLAAKYISAGDRITAAQAVLAIAHLGECILCERGTEQTLRILDEDGLPDGEPRPWQIKPPGFSWLQSRRAVVN